MAGSMIIKGDLFINKSALYNYNCSNRGLLLPLMSEYTWGVPVRATLYLAGLLYCFLGVAIIADIFMGAIEKITSRTKKVFLTTNTKDEPEYIEVRIWSDAVANLTLMALGSSAPEILLSCIEVVGNNFESGELGPGTIVGSAAFNLFVISAVCVMCIPKGEVKRIKDIKVFAITSVFSLVAYLWLLIMLVAISPDVVEVWEACVTLGLFPLLILLAWLAEKNVCGVPSKTEASKQMELGNFEPGESDMLVKDRQYFRDGHLDRDGLVRFIKEVKKYPGLTDEDTAVLAASKLVESQTHSRMWYRVGAVRSMTGGRKTLPQLSFKLKESVINVVEKMHRSKTDTESIYYKDSSEVSSLGNVHSTSNSVAAMSTLSVHSSDVVEDIEKKADLSSLPSRIFKKKKPLVSLKDATHEAIDDSLHHVYDAMNEHPDAPTLGEVPVVKPFENAIIDFHASSCAVLEDIGTFKVELQRSGRTDNTVSVRIETIEGSATEGADYVSIDKTVTFEAGETTAYVDVEIVNDNQWEPDEEFYLRMSLLNDAESRVGVQLGRISIMEIVILNDDEPGVISFPRRGLLVKESIGTALIPVIRRNGADGEVSVHWRTVDKSAINNKDFKGGEGILVFKHTEVELNIEIPIIDDMTAEKDEHFEVELFDPEGGVKLGTITKMAITITNDDDFDSVLAKLMSLTNANIHALQVHNETYASQFKDALNVNGGDIENATTKDYILHFFTFGWKILFAFVPPPGLLGGWLCFFVSLVAIGLLTAIIGDLAAIFGCLVGLKDTVTAITFVALGTSLPDTFASKTAAVQEKHADNAIGNVTGSNSVNVFLGLGLPWLIAAAYHAAKGSTFVVKSGSLGFSVGVFTGLSIVCLGIILLRRFSAFFGKGELGGPNCPKYFTGIVFIFLWILYVLVASLQAYNYF